MSALLPIHSGFSQHGKFDLGAVVGTPAAIVALQRARVAAQTLLTRHLRGDWGDLCAADGADNDAALATGGRLMSVYPLGDGAVIWVITEGDRSVTTLLTPDDY